MGWDMPPHGERVFEWDFSGKAEWLWCVHARGAACGWGDGGIDGIDGTQGRRWMRKVPRRKSVRKCGGTP